MNDVGEKIAAAVAAIFGVAVLAIIVSQRATTASVLTSFFGGLSNLIGVAISPITGQQVAGLGASGLTGGSWGTGGISGYAGSASGMSGLNIGGVLGGFGSLLGGIGGGSSGGLGGFGSLLGGGGSGGGGFIDSGGFDVSSVAGLAADSFL